MAYYISEDFGDYDYQIGTSNIPALGPGGTASFNFSIDASTLSISPGFYFLEFYIDYEDVVDESNEEDNHWYWAESPHRVLISESPYCGSTTVLDEPSGSFSDGSGGNDYSIHTYCQWLIQPTEATESITLSFSAFDTESGYDYVRCTTDLPETATLLGIWSGSGIPGPVVSSGGACWCGLAATTASTRAVSAPRTTTAALSACHDLNTFTFPEGTITDGSGEEDYLNNSDCAWLIQPDEQTGDITLSFEEFDLETGRLPPDLRRKGCRRSAAGPIYRRFLAGRGFLRKRHPFPPIRKQRQHRGGRVCASLHHLSPAARRHGSRICEKRGRAFRAPYQRFVQRRERLPHLRGRKISFRRSARG
ncbi:MAG: hypothetical protein IPH04_14155 [Saprospirales bacterium]|nr:hypothetical protein [Saprospirales bacterium]